MFGAPLRPLNYIDGRRQAAADGSVFETINPYDEQVWAYLPDSDAADVDAAVTAARRAFDAGPWPATTAAERSRLLYRLADLVEENARDLAVVETTDNGKLLREVTPQIEALPQWYRFYAGAESVAASSASVHRRRRLIGPRSVRTGRSDHDRTTNDLGRSWT